MRNPGKPLSANSDTAAGARPLGVYVHFPYCLKKCPYCDFASLGVARETIPHARYADAVIAELGRRAAVLAPEVRLETVFVGGGTPSLWEPAEIARVFSAILAAFPSRAGEVEVSMECNPTSLDEARARAFRDAGANRLSVGVQSLDPERLAFLGRLHDEHGGLVALRQALAAGVRVSGDLIFGVQGGRPQSAEQAAAEAVAVAETGVSHVSAYGLTIEPNTAFGAEARRGRLPIASDDAIADSFVAVEQALLARGFRHYEISNYARPGQEARHNLGYWRGHDYLGLGAAAVGTLSEDTHAVRYKNHPAPERYMASAALGLPDVIEREELDGEARLRERLMLGLRLEDGIDLAAIGAQLGVDPFTAERRRAMERLERRARLHVDGARLRVPAAARAFTDGVIAELF